MSFMPLAAAYGLGAVVGGLTFLSPGIAVVVAIVLLGLPILAADFLAGVTFLVIGLAAVQFLGQDNGRAFGIILGAFAGVVLGPAWAAPILAGYLLGPAEGAVTALVACVVVQVGGIATGRETLGLLVTGGASPALVSFAAPPDNLLALSGIHSVPMLVAQPIVWSLSATAAGFVRRPLEDPRRAPFGLVAALAGAAAAAAGTAIAYVTVGGGIPGGLGIVTAAGTSLLAAGVVIGVWEWAFPAIQAAPSAARIGVSAEDADVDELLRLIATAEDELTSKHTTQAVVMITDMKSFSKMTEEEGSIVSAKTIQRHRDLLLPIIAEHHGCGKSTGGDGLVAAFNSPADALRAAVAMQAVLAEHNASHPAEREIVIRIGVASGEVVLDKGGRPFIGSALNLAARVMNLGEGGQVFTTRAVVSAAKEASGLVTHSHGGFELKNIATPVEVLEILWAPDQAPAIPRSTAD
jgi:class 3 adenylate cyclase